VFQSGPRLSITSPAHLARTVTLAGVTTIGRDSDNDIVLDEATLSRCHAVLLAGSQGIALMDLDSTNGTLVNGMLVSPDTPVPLADGDLIALGQVLARYHDGAERHSETQGNT
jgi:pSer/pThr/pTyr-binding forkhead associated (FHA) protein